MALAENLYEQDFYAWASEQAEVLRRRETGANALDWENLAEEVESLGREQLHACERLLRQIVDHFAKIALADEGQLTAVRHWRLEIGAFRSQIDDRLTPSLRRKFRERAPGVIDRTLKAWREVDAEASVSWRADPPSLAQCLDDDVFPTAGSRSLRPAETA